MGNIILVTQPVQPAHVLTYTRRNQLETFTLPDAGSGVAMAIERRFYDAESTEAL